MNTNLPIRNRRTIRIQGYDYSQTGLYFVTICTNKHTCIFGNIENGEMRLNHIGEIVAEELVRTAKLREKIELDESVVMPNHFHAILSIVASKGTARRARTKEEFGKPVEYSIPTIVRAFKSAVSNRINKLNQTPGRKVWHRNYWERVIRNEIELNQIRNYIKNNPAQWDLDKLNPKLIQQSSVGARRAVPVQSKTEIL